MTMEINLKVIKAQPHHNFWVEQIGEIDTKVKAVDCAICATGLVTVSNLKNRKCKPIFSRSICPQCGFLTLSRGPSDIWMRDYYDNRWDEKRPDLANQHDQLSNQFPLQYLKRVEGGKPEKEQNILDVGAGYGMAIRAFIKDGYKNIFAIEHSIKRASHIRKTFDIPAEHCSLEDFLSSATFAKSGRFDYIYLWHVFEHMTDVKTNLGILYDLLADDGHIFIAVPNFHRESFICLSHSPVHQHAFSANNLFLFVQDAGFKVKIVDQGYNTGGLILVGQKQQTLERGCAPQEFTQQEIARKILRDLDLDSGYNPWKANEPFLLKLFDARPTNACILKTQFRGGGFGHLMHLLERLSRNHMKLPDFSMMVEFDEFNPKVRDYIYDYTCTKLIPENCQLPVVNFIYADGRVPIWLK